MKKEEHLEKFEKLVKDTQNLTQQEQHDICMFIQGYVTCRKSLMSGKQQKIVN